MDPDLIVIPAYGRDYSSAADALAAWEANTDFQCVGLYDDGRYVNKADAAKYAPNRKVKIRYAKQTKVVYVK